MTERFFLKTLALTLVLTAGAAVRPAAADGLIQSLFNTKGSGGAASPLFLSHKTGTAGALAGKSATPHTFGALSGDRRERPSAAEAIAKTRDTDAANNAAVIASVSQQIAASNALREAATLKANAARLASMQNASKQSVDAAQAAATQAAKASASAGAMHAPDINAAAAAIVPPTIRPADTPLYNAPAQSTGAAPVFSLQ